ncbi:MAG: FlgD immunoglobulin-like domain containing protein [bacterium]|nr:FlgD immunoglobulin-like domain containing protein [bacterium]
MDNFNDASAPNLQNGGYDVFGYFGGTGSITYDQTSCFGSSGYSLKFQYSVVTASTSGVQLWMNFKQNGASIIPVNLTNYDYLSFWLKGEAGGEVLRIMLKDAGGIYQWVDIRNYLPAGMITTSWQKAVIPLISFRYDKFDERNIYTLYFFAVNGIGPNTGTVYLDEILLAKGAGPVYVDTFEYDSRPDASGSELNSFSFDIYANGQGSDVSQTHFATNILTNAAYSGNGAYYIKHISHQQGVGWVYNQSVWMFGYLGITPSMDVSGCDRLQFRMKKGSNNTSEKNRYIHLGYDNGGAPVNSAGLLLSNLTTSWQQTNIPLSSFGAINLNRLLDFKLVSENNSGDTTNITFLDEIIFMDTRLPQAPTNICVNGIRLTNNFLLDLENLVTADIFSNENLDKSLEAVKLEYRSDKGVWRTAGFDYNTYRSSFTNLWIAGGLSTTNRIDLRVSSVDSSTNSRSVLFTNCRVPTSAYYASCDMRFDPPVENQLSLYSEATYFTNSIGGSASRRTFGDWASLTFDVKSSFAEKVTTDDYYYVLAIEYYDTGLNKQFMLAYDNRDNLPASVNMKELALSKMKDTHVWKTNYTLISDAYFGNRANGADIIIKGEEMTFVRRIVLYKIPAANSATSLKLTSSDLELGVGTLNQISVEAVNQFGFRDVNYSGNVDLSVNGSAVLDQSSLSLANGLGYVYLVNGKEETVQLSVQKAGLNAYSLNADFRLFYGLDQSKNVKILFSNPVVYSNLYVVSPIYPVTLAGQDGYRTGDAEWSLMLFDIDDSFVYDRLINDGYVYDITIEYFDQYTATDNDENKRVIILKYDSIGMTTDSRGNYVWQLCDQKVVRENSRTWKTFTFTITDPRFGNRLDQTGDFTLSAWDPVSLRSVKVSKRNYYYLDRNADLSISSAKAGLLVRKKSTAEDYYIIPYNLLRLPQDKVPGSYGYSYSINNPSLAAGCDFLVYDMSFKKVENLYLGQTAGLELLYGRNTFPVYLAEDNLAVYFYKDGDWEKKGGDLDKVNKKMSLNIDHLSLYALFESNPGRDFMVQWENNPFSPNRDGIMDKGLLHVVLEKPAKNLRVFIYNIKGAFIRELPRHQTSTGQLFEWDGTDDRGKNVPIGAYIYQVEYDSKVYNGIVGVVR